MTQVLSIQTVDRDRVSPPPLTNLRAYTLTHSVGTIDPDYQTHYPGTVSSAGGTIGSRTFLSRLSGGDSIRTPGNDTFGTQSIYTNENDDQSFQNHLHRATDRPHTRQDVFEVIAPAGKLGVVIDTPNSGAPVIHSIKEDCLIAGRLLRGDNENVIVVVGTTQ